MRRILAFSLLVALAVPRSWADVYSVGLDASQYTSDFLIGKVAVAVIFPESDGTLDPKTEKWSDERKTQVLSKVMAGLDWWTRQNPKSPLSFTLVSQTVSTKYEPITRPYYDEAVCFGF